MTWRSNKIWIPLFIVCFGFLILTPFAVQKAAPPHVYKSLPPVLGTPPPVAMYAPAPINYLDIGLKIGSCLGVLMTLINLVEKVIKWVRPKAVKHV